MNAQVDGALVYLLLAMLACVPLFVVFSPQAQRRIGIWLIARADASVKSREYFIARRKHLRDLTEPGGRKVTDITGFLAAEKGTSS